MLVIVLGVLAVLAVIAAVVVVLTQGDDDGSGAGDLPSGCSDGDFVCITDVEVLDDTRLSAEFTAPDGAIALFFVDTVAASAVESGVGPFRIQDGPSPFVGFFENEREGATALCVMLDDGSNRGVPGSGNCRPIDGS